MAMSHSDPSVTRMSHSCGSDFLIALLFSNQNPAYNFKTLTEICEHFQIEIHHREASLN